MNLSGNVTVTGLGWIALAIVALAFAAGPATPIAVARLTDTTFVVIRGSGTFVCDSKAASCQFLQRVP